MKKKINVFDYTNQIMRTLSKGVLLTTKSGNRVNSMTISWGAFGIEWAKPIFSVYVRQSRFTKKLLEENPEFTINIPLNDYDKKIISFCGTKSGNDVDKIKEMNLTLVDSELISVPSIKEFPLTLECKVIYKQLQDKNQISEEMKVKFYPEEVSSDFHGANKDFHTVFYGEIVDAYIIE
ncbi:MAG: flavin reductase family protein [Pleomorphochaeta sp.]